jgi:SSS family solute:Na+ symporter
MSVDLWIVSLYFVLTIWIGFYYGKNVKTLREFAVADRNYSNSVMLATLFATVIGGGSTFGVSSKVFSVGILFLLAFYGAVLNKIIVAQWVAPRIGRFQNCTSLGDSIASLYGSQGRFVAGICISLVSIGSIGSQVTAVGFVSEYLLGIPFSLGVWIGFGVLILYSAFGGVRSVIATDVFQFVLILTFVPIAFLIGLHKVGGFSNFLQAIPAEKLSLYPSPESFKKALTLFVVMSFSALDPSFIQRLLISKTAQQAIRITRITGYLSIPLFTLMGAMGLISFLLNPDLNPNHALAYLVDQALPIGFRGLAVAGLLATLMSTADSDLHVLGLSLVQDVVLPLSKTHYSEKKKLRLLQIITFLAGIFSVLVALHFQNIIDIMIFAFSFWGPTVLVPFLFALYGVTFSKNEFLVGVFLGFSSVVAWNLTLEKSTGLDGFIPAILLNSLYFWIQKRRAESILRVQSQF